MIISASRYCVIYFLSLIKDLQKKVDLKKCFDVNLNVRSHTNRKPAINTKMSRLTFILLQKFANQIKLNESIEFLTR